MLESVLAFQMSNTALLIVSLLSVSGFAMALTTIRSMKKYQRQQKGMYRRLQEDNRALSKSAIGMGQKVLETERRLNEVLKKQFAILNSQPEHPSYDQASRLIKMGASENDLVSSCGFSHAEAELLLSLNKQGKTTAHMH
jgi:hypothetical protein